MTLPPTIPVMLLRQCNVFPHGLLPLYIFEPRYRLMLRYALEHDRLLCIGNLKPAAPVPHPSHPAGTDGSTLSLLPGGGGDDSGAHVPPDEADPLICEHSTAAVIRACVENEDGTSHLVLQGMSRVRLKEWVQYRPFRIARVEPVQTCRRTSRGKGLPPAGHRLLEKALSIIGCDSSHGRQLAEQLGTLTDPDHLVDFIAGNLVRDAMLRQPLLGMRFVEDRLDYLLNLLSERGRKAGA